MDSNRKIHGENQIIDTLLIATHMADTGIEVAATLVINCRFISRNVLYISKCKCNKNI